MKILITGGTGRLGIETYTELRKIGEVVVFGRSEPVQIKNVRFVQGDLRNLDEVEKAMKGIDVVVHLGAIPRNIEDQKLLFDTNIAGTFHVLESAVKNNVSKVVYASSTLAIGAGYTFKGTAMQVEYLPFDEKHPCRPDDLYGLSKYLGEEMCKMYSRRYGISTICLRLGWIMFKKETYMKLFKHNEGRYKNTYKNFWCYVDVRDAVKAIKLAVEVKNIGCETFYITAADFIACEKELLSLLKRYPRVQCIRDDKGFLTGGAKSFFDIAKAKRVLGYNPEYSFENII